MTAHNNRIAAKIKRLWQKGDIFKEKCRYYDRREFFECVFESKDPQILFSVHQGERKFVLEDRVFEELCITDARDFCDYVRFFQLMDVLWKFFQAIGRGNRFDHLWDNPIDDKFIARFLLRHLKRHNFSRCLYSLKPSRTRLAVLLLNDAFKVNLVWIKEDDWNLIRTDPMIAKAFDRYFFKLAMVQNDDFYTLSSYSNHVYNSSLAKYSRNPMMARIQRFIRGDMSELDAFLGKDLGAKNDGADLFIRRFLQFSFENLPSDDYDENDEEVYELEQKCMFKVLSDSNNFSRFIFRTINRDFTPNLERYCISLLRFDVEPFRPVYGSRIYRILEYNLTHAREDLMLLLLRTGSAALIRRVNRHVSFDVDHILTVQPELEPRIIELLYEGAFVYNISSKEVRRDCFRRRPSDSDLERAYKSILTGRLDLVPLFKCLLEKQIKCYKREWLRRYKEKILSKVLLL